ncbi:MAG TPA: c-type cytochrome domain-containing protein, partial [Pirellulales bacterium]
MRTAWAWLLCGLGCLGTGFGAAPAAAEEISFTKQIAPLLVKNCVACHGPKDFKGGYQLHTFDVLMKPGESESPAIKPGDPAGSYLFDLLTSTDASSRMPLESDPLPADKIALVKTWIEQGAKYDSPDVHATLASIAPKEPHPAAPEAYRVAMPITAVAFRPDGNELAVGGYHEITLWNPADGSLVKRIGNVAERTYGLAYRPNGQLLAAASGTPGQIGEIRLYNPADGSLVKDLATLPDVAFDVAFSADGSRLAACGADRSIRVFNVESGTQELLIEDHADWVLAIAWSADGKFLASASRDKTSKVFDAATGDSQITYPGHQNTVFGVAFSPDGNQVLSSGADKQIHIWNRSDAKKEANIGGFGNDVFKLALVNGVIVSESADKTARLHTFADRKQIQQFAGNSDWVYAASYNEPTKRLATGSYDGDVRIYNTADGKEVLRFKAAPGL